MSPKALGVGQWGCRMQGMGVPKGCRSPRDAGPQGMQGAGVQGMQRAAGP